MKVVFISNNNSNLHCIEQFISQGKMHFVPTSFTLEDILQAITETYLVIVGEVAKAPQDLDYLRELEVTTLIVVVTDKMDIIDVDLYLSVLFTDGGKSITQVITVEDNTESAICPMRILDLDGEKSKS